MGGRAGSKIFLNKRGFQTDGFPLLLLLPPICWAASALQGFRQQPKCEGCCLAHQTPPCDIRLMLKTVSPHSVIIYYNICFTNCFLKTNMYVHVNVEKKKKKKKKKVICVDTT